VSPKSLLTANQIIDRLIASIITTIVCPDDLIATVSALTLSIRVLGGVVGYAVYYNVFYNKFVALAKEQIPGMLNSSLPLRAKHEN
jgi:hypothetical protein